MICHSSAIGPAPQAVTKDSEVEHKSQKGLEQAITSRRVSRLGYRKSKQRRSGDSGGGNQSRGGSEVEDWQSEHGKPDT